MTGSLALRQRSGLVVQFSNHTALKMPGGHRATDAADSENQVREAPRTLVIVVAVRASRAEAR
jgi:hypothetical protein